MFVLPFCICSFKYCYIYFLKNLPLSTFTFLHILLSVSQEPLYIFSHSVPAINLASDTTNNKFCCVTPYSLRWGRRFPTQRTSVNLEDNEEEEFSEQATAVLSSQSLTVSLKMKMMRLTILSSATIKCGCQKWWNCTFSLPKEWGHTALLPVWCSQRRQKWWLVLCRRSDLISNSSFQMPSRKSSGSRNVPDLNAVLGPVATKRLFYWLTQIHVSFTVYLFKINMFFNHIFVIIYLFHCNYFSL